MQNFIVRKSKGFKHAVIFIVIVSIVMVLYVIEYNVSNKIYTSSYEYWLYGVVLLNYLAILLQMCIVSDLKIKVEEDKIFLEILNTRVVLKNSDLSIIKNKVYLVSLGATDGILLNVWGLHFTIGKSWDNYKTLRNYIEGIKSNLK